MVHVSPWIVVAHPTKKCGLERSFFLVFVNIDPGSHRGWKISEMNELFRVYEHLPKGSML